MINTLISVYMLVSETFQERVFQQRDQVYKIRDFLLFFCLFLGRGNKLADLVIFYFLLLCVLNFI